MAEQSNYQIPEGLLKFRGVALGIGALGLIAWFVGVYFNTEQALRSWLIAFIFWGGLCFGGLGILMLQFLTGGAWGVVIRRIMEAASRTWPVVLAAFLPIAIGVTKLYEWTHLGPDDYTVKHRGWFMTPESWWLRSAVYFALIILMIQLLNGWSARQDKSVDYTEGGEWLAKASRFSGPAMVFYALIMTFATVDWVMMLDPHWFSTIWGLLFLAGWGLSCFCFCVILLAYMSDKSPMNMVINKKHFHDIGKLMLAFVMIWAYFNFSQFLIIWSGNIPEETGWYIVRTKGGWAVIGVLLVVLHFAVPFLILLQQDFKRRAKQLALLAGFLMLMRLVDLFYLIEPSPRIDHHIAKGAFVLSWMDIVAPIALGGFWLWYFIGQLSKRPLVPVMDPFFKSAVDHGKAH